MKLLLLIIRKFLSSSKDKNYISKLSFSSYILVALAVIVPVLVLSVTNGFQTVVEKNIIEYDFHFQVYFKNLGSLADIQLPKNIDPKNIVFAGFYEDKCLIEYRGISRITQLRAFLLEDYKNKKLNDSYKTYYEGIEKYPSLRGIVLAENLAFSLGITVGDIVTLTVIDHSIGHKPFSQKKFRVDGIVSLGYASYDSTVSFITKEDADSLFLIESDTINKVGFKLKRKNDLLEMEKFLKSTYPDQLIKNTYETRLFKDFKEEKKSLSLAMLIIMLIAFIAIFITLNVVLADKRMDIVLLRVLGLPDNHILSIFLGQGIFIAFVGSFLGFFVASSVIINLDNIVLGIEEVVNNFLFWFDKIGIIRLSPYDRFQIMPQDTFYLSSLPYRLFWSDFIIQGIGAFFFALLASLNPGLKVLKIRNSEMLRNE